MGANASNNVETPARPRRVKLREWSVAALLCMMVIVLASHANGGQEQQARGRQEFGDAGCATCHGPSAKGGTAPRVAGTSHTYPDFLRIVREGIGEMPPLSQSDVSDEQAVIIHEWLVQLSSTRSGNEGFTAALNSHTLNRRRLR